MIEKRKLESDKKLIQVLFATEPLDWARRDDGTLVFLYQDGRKMVVTPEDLALLTDKKLAEKEVAQRKTALPRPQKKRSKFILSEAKDCHLRQLPQPQNQRLPLSPP